MGKLLVASDIHAVGERGRLREVLENCKKDWGGERPDTVFLGGDLVGHQGMDPTITEEERRRNWTPAFRVEELKEEVRRLLGGVPQVYCSYGSHDKCALEGPSGFLAGPADRGDYYIYGISFCEMRFATMAQRQEIHRGRAYDGIDPGCAGEAIERFLLWEKEHRDSKPLFLLSHIPLHAHRKDNLGAALWCDALNEAGRYRDTFLFFGHNHTAENRTSLDRQFYLVPAGSKMPVPLSDPEEQRERTLNFTYLNAGYIVKGAATSLIISPDTVLIRRHAVDPRERDFGDTGIPSPWRMERRFRE